MTWLHTIPPLGSLETCCLRHLGSPKQNPSSGQPQTKPRRYTEWRERSDCLQGMVFVCRIDVFGAGNYALVITSRTEVGTYLGFPVYRVTLMRFLSCNEGMKNSTAEEKKDEAHFMAQLKTVQSTPGLYFSFQRRCKLVEGWMAKSIWKQADPRFVWNRNLLDELIE